MLTAAILGAALLAGLAGCERAQLDSRTAPKQEVAAPVPSTNDPAMKTEAEWKRALTPEQFRVLREKGTERAYTGRYWNHHEPGRYRCAGCGQELFDSTTKFDSGCGWPSFTTPAATNQVTTREDHSLSMERTEVLCSRCGGHLGHVFPDGPAPTGLRYCINSVSLEFEPAGASVPTGEKADPGQTRSPTDAPR
jgi:peptide-methionine (R)-S-oxide reductase